MIPDTRYQIPDARMPDGRLLASCSGTREIGLYLVIKLLEFEFDTTLGYPKKLCNGAGTWGCSSDDRARDWMNYLESKKLAKPFVNIPWSISPLDFD